MALDGSQPSRRAFELSLELAANFYAKLLIVNVVRAIEVEAVCGHEMMYYGLLCEEAKDKGIWCKYRIALGHPVDQVLRAAEDIRADLIVISRSGFNHSTWGIFGSIPERILHEAHCPVTIVK